VEGLSRTHVGWPIRENFRNFRKWTMADLFDELMEKINAGRDALITRYTWFTHVTSENYLQSIQAEGLRPSKVDYPPSLRDRLLAERKHFVVCLHPLGSKLKPSGGGEAPHRTLAVHKAALPKLISLDWSYEWQSYIEKRRHDLPNEPFSEFIVAVAQCLGSIISYEPIAPSDLKIQLDPATDDPSTWPSLTNT
jgi:hypothetical protein